MGILDVLFGKEVALIRACRKGNSDKAKKLLDEGVDPNTEKEGRGSAIQGAATSGYREVIELLIAHNADINAKDSDGMSALHWTAAVTDDSDMASFLIESGIDIEAQTNDGETALHTAVDNDHPAVVKVLLDKGANTEIKTKGKWWNEPKSALEVAEEKDLQNIIALFK